MRLRNSETNLDRLRACLTDARVVHLALLGAVLLAGAWVRLYALPRESPWHDEALTILHLDSPSLPAYLDRVMTQDPIPRLAPAYYVVQYAWSRVCGVSVAAVRTLSALFGIAAIALLYTLGRRLFGAGAGLLAALALSLSMVNIYYAQEIRFYAMTNLLALGSMWAFVRVFEDGRRRDWGLLLLCSALLFWTHSVAPLLLLPQGVYLLLFHRRGRTQVIAWFGAHALISAAYAVWAVHIGYDLDAAAAHYNDMPGSWREFLNALLVFAGGRPDNRDPSPLMPAGVSLDYFIAITTCVLVLGFCFKTWTACQGYASIEPQDTVRPDGGCSGENARGPSVRMRAVILLCLWLLVPLVALYVVSHTWRPFFYYRYVLHSSLPVCLLMGGALAGLREERMRIGLAAALFAACAYQNLAIPRPFRPNFLEAAALVEDRIAEDGLVYAFKPLNGLAFRCNSRLPDDRIVTYEGFPELCHDTASVVKSAPAAGAAAREVWVVFTLWSRLDDFAEHMTAAGLEIEWFVYPGLTELTLCRVFMPETGA